MKKAIIGILVAVSMLFSVTACQDTVDLTGLRSMKTAIRLAHAGMLGSQYSPDEALAVTQELRTAIAIAEGGITADMLMEMLAGKLTGPKSAVMLAVVQEEFNLLNFDTSLPMNDLQLDAIKDLLDGLDRSSNLYKMTTL